MISIILLGIVIIGVIVLDIYLLKDGYDYNLFFVVSLVIFMTPFCAKTTMKDLDNKLVEVNSQKELLDSMNKPESFTLEEIDSNRYLVEYLKY